MLVLACTWVKGLLQVFLQGNVENCILLSLSSVNEKFEAKVSVFSLEAKEKGDFFIVNESF
jgi:hypothetical protein